MADAGGSINGSISLASRVTALRNALFQALIVMQKRGAHGNGATSAIALLIKWLQMMAFLYISPDFNWNKDISAPIRVLALIPSPAGWFKFSATIAYIPLLTMLLSVYMCGAGEVQSGTVDQWASTGYACLKGGHLALVVLATIFSTVFASLAALFAVVFYVNHPLSSSLASKVHGRAEFILLVIKTVLILTIEIFPTKLGGPWALIGINIAAAACWVGVILYYMPMIHHRMNALHMALGCLYLWAGICLAIGMSSTVDGAVILYVGSPVALGVGVALAGWRRDSVMSRATSKLANVYEIEMKSRFTLIKTVAALMEMSTAMATKSETSALMQEDDDIALAVAGVGGGLGTARAGGARFEDMTSPRSLADGATKTSARRGSARDSRGKKSTDESDFAIFAASYRALDSESRERILKDKLPLKTLLECEAMFKNGVMRFPTSAVLHMFQSQFYSVFKHDRHLATSHLLLTNRLSPALDIAYLAFQARRAAENAGSAGVLSSAMHRVSFDKHLAYAKASTMKAAQAQVSFWQELCDTKPDINNLHQIAAQLSIHTALAESNFKEAFALQPQSLAAMRLFAQYNLSVANNPEKASAISAEAERIEDQKNKEQNAPAGGNTTHTGFPFNEEVPLETMTDAVAMVTVGATSRDLGIIISANAAACKLLGYTRLQLERRNVSIIVPSPFMESHDLYMRRYLSTGEGRFVETVRSTLGKHRLGHLVPMSIMIKETNLSDNTPVFHATLRPINFNDHVIQMDEDWVVVGGTAGALMALQVDAATLSASEVCMADYCPSLNDAEAVTDLMGRAQGDVVQMRLPGFSAGPSQAGDPNGSSGDGNGKSTRGSMVSSESFAAPLALAATGGSRVDPWSKPVDVKATLASYNQKGNHINILTFRLLSTNEQAQRANAQASRRASIAAGSAPGMGRPLPSFRRSLASQDGGPSIRTPQVPALSRGRSGESAGSVNESVKSGADHDSIALGMDDNSRAGSPGADSAGLPASHPPINAASFAGAVCPVMRSSPARSQDGSSESVAPIAVTRAVRVSSSPPPPLSALGGPAGSVGTTDPSAAKRLKKKIASVRIHDEAVEVEGQMVPTPYGRLSHGKGDIDQGEKARAARWGRSDDADDDDDERQEHRVDVYDHRSSSPSRKTHENQGDEKHNNRRSSINDGKGSVRSGGSSSKRSSVGRTTLNKLRRIVAESASGVGTTKGVPGLSLLYLTGWLLLVLNMGLGVLTAILLDANFVDYARNLRFAAVAGVTTQQQTRALRLLIQRSLYNRGWLALNSQSDHQAGAEMSAVADLYASSTSRMYSLVDGTDRSSFFTAPVLEYVDFTEAVPEPKGRVSEGVLKAMLLGKEFWPWSLGNGGVLVGTRRTTTLLDFSALWTGTLKQLSNMPTANITTDEPQVLFVVANTQPGAPAHEYIRRAIFESYLASEDSQKLLTTLVLWIFVAMGPVLGAVLLTVVIPILLYIDHKRDNIMESFLDLPALIIMYLRAGAERRLRSLRSDEEGEGGSEDDEEDEEARRALSLGIDGENPDLELEDGTVDWEAVFARVTVEASRAEKKRMKKLMGGGAKGGKGEAAAAAAGRSPKASAYSGCARSAVSEAAKKSAVHHRSMCSRGTRAPGGFYRSVINADGSVSTFIRRDYKKSSKSFVGLAVFLVPVLLMFIFYLVLYLVTMNTVDRVIAMSAFTSLSAMRSAALRSAANAVMYMVATPGYAPEEAFRYEFTSQKIVDTVATNKLLVYNVRTFAQTGVDAGIGPSLDYKKSEGTESSSVPGMPSEAMARIRTAQDKDACPFILEALGNPASFDMVKCREFNGGVLTSGLQAGLRDFVRRLRKLRDRRWNANVPVNTSDGTGILSITTSSDWGTAFEGTTLDGSNNGLTNVADGGTYVHGSSSTTTAGQGETLSGLNNTVTTRVPYSIVRELQSDDWVIADDMMRYYLLPAFTYTSESYGLSGEQIVTDYRVFLMAFVGGFLALYSLGTLFLYLPAITTLAKDVQSKRAMLLLVPATIIAKVPSLRAMVLQIVAEHESGGAAAATVGRGEAVDEEEAPPAVAVDAAA